MIEFRCKDLECNRRLGDIDSEGNFIFRSKREEKTMIIKEGTIICDNVKRHTMKNSLKYEFKNMR